MIGVKEGKHLFSDINASLYNQTFYILNFPIFNIAPTQKELKSIYTSETRLIYAAIIFRQKA